MTDLFEPSYAVLAFFFAKKFVFYPVTFILALFRFFVGPWLSRFFALLVMAACTVAIVLTFASNLPRDVPEVAQLLEHPEFPRMLEIMNLYNGMFVPLWISVLFVLSSVLRKNRASWIDFIFYALMFMMMILWAATTYLF